MATEFTHTSWATAKATLASMLGDSASIHWTADEIALYLTEALRVWNASTAYHRADATPFNLTPGTYLYDLTAVAELSALLTETVTDRDLIGQIQYHMLEPYSPAVWTGTLMWTLSDLTTALQRRRDSFIAATGEYLVHTVTGTIFSPVHDLDENIVGVRRAVWITDADGEHHALQSSDEFTSDSSNRSWRQTPDTPRGYSLAASPNLRMQFMPPPASSGTLDLLLATSPNTFAPASSASLVGIADDISWGVKWGAMSDMLRQEGPGRDEDRAAFCEELWNLSIALQSTLPIVLQASLNEVPLSFSTLRKIDRTRTGWSGGERGTPDVVAMEGHVLALCPVPSSADSLALTIVRNAPIPTADEDFVQVAREDMEAVYQWAFQLAAFKSGSVTLSSARVAAQQLLQQAVRYNEQRLLQSTYLAELLTRGSETYVALTGNRDGASDNEGDSGTENASTRSSPERSRLLRRRRRLGGIRG